MSGGGKQACKGRIGKALVVDLNPEEIIDLEKQLEQVFFKPLCIMDIILN
jgi:hypothetical protein